MAKTKAKDVFTNVAYAKVTESAANTLTFSEINTGVSVHQKIAWVISRVDWFMAPADLDAINATGEGLYMALTLNNKVDDIADMADPAIIAMTGVFSIASGAPATLIIKEVPYRQDFADLPGKGLIITPKPLYVAAMGRGLAAATTPSCRIYYTVMELAADEFWELVQASRIVQ